MYDLYAWNTPNGQKAHIALEETGAAYQYHPVDITKAEQHTASFRALSPDGKIPALVHQHTPTTRVFESGAILVYLAQHFPALDGNNDAEKARVLSWMFWQVGQLGPMAGQFGRFHREAPENTTAISHFEQLVWRCLKVMDERLRQSDYLASKRFTIADIACFPWVASPESYLQRYDVAWREVCPALARWSEQLLDRPSVRKSLSL